MGKSLRGGGGHKSLTGKLGAHHTQEGMQNAPAAKGAGLAGNYCHCGIPAPQGGDRAPWLSMLGQVWKLKHTLGAPRSPSGPALRHSEPVLHAQVPPSAPSSQLSLQPSIDQPADTVSRTDQKADKTRAAGPTK